MAVSTNWGGPLSECPYNASPTTWDPYWGPWLLATPIWNYGVYEPGSLRSTFHQVRIIASGVHHPSGLGARRLAHVLTKICESETHRTSTQNGVEAEAPAHPGKQITAAGLAFWIPRGPFMIGTFFGLTSSWVITQNLPWYGLSGVATGRL